MRATLILIQVILVSLLLPIAAYASSIDLENLPIDASPDEIIIVSHDMDVRAEAIELGYAGAYDEVQEAIDESFDGATIFIDEGTYGMFEINTNVVGMRITGLNPLIESTQGWGNVVDIYFGENIMLDSLRIAHYDQASHFGSVINISCSKYISIRNCDIYGPGEAGIHMLSSEDISIIGNRIHDITYTAIKTAMWQVDTVGCPNRVSGLDIRDNYIYNTPLAIEGYTSDSDPLDYYTMNYFYDPDLGPSDEESFSLHYIDPTLLLATTTLVSHDPVVIEAAEELGVREVFTNIQMAVEYSEPGDTIVVCPGTYQTFKVPDYVHGITILGCGADFVSSNSFNPVIEILNTSDIVFENLNVYHVVDGVCQGGCFHICGSRDITITGCDIHGSGVFGIWIDMSEDIEITNNLIHDCTWTGLQLESADWFCSSEIWRIGRILVEENYFYRNATDLVDNWGDYWQVVPFRKNNYFEEPDWIND